MSTLNSLPDWALLRARQILGDSKSDPPLPAIIPVGHSAWYQGVADGIYPKPVAIGKRAKAWLVRDIRELAEKGVTATGAVSDPTSTNGGVPNRKGRQPKAA